MKLDTLIKEELAILLEINETAGKHISDDFFDDVVRNIGGTPTPETRKFFKAWQSAEGTNAKNNPLATTWDKQVPGQTDFNSVGVKNYPNQETGVSATVNTLTKGNSAINYRNLISKIQSGATAEELANTPDAFTAWTGQSSKSDYVTRVLGGNTTNSDKIGPEFTEEEKQILGSIPGSKYGISKTAWLDGKRQHYYQFGKKSIDNIVLLFPKGKGYIAELNDSGEYKVFDPSTWEVEGNDVIVSSDDNNIKLTYKSSQSKPDVEIPNETIDDIQDWIGWATLGLSFVFPGFSDIVDLLNGGVYFIRGKNIDGALSMLAAVPIVGSIASRSIKVAMKSLRGMKGGEAALRLFNKSVKMKDAAGMAKFLTKLTETGKIPPGLYDDVAAGLEKAYAQVDKLKNLDQIKEMEKVQYAIDEIHSAVKFLYDSTSIASKAGKGVKATKSAAIFTKMLSKVGITPTVGKQITTDLLRRGAQIYTNRMIKNPDLFAKHYNTLQKSLGRGIRPAGSWKNLYKKNPDEYAKQVRTYMENNPIEKSDLFADKLAKLALKPNYFKEFFIGKTWTDKLLRSGTLQKLAWSFYTKLPANMARYIDDQYGINVEMKEKLKNPAGVTFDTDMILAIYIAYMREAFGPQMINLFTDKETE